MADEAKALRSIPPFPSFSPVQVPWSFAPRHPLPSDLRLVV